MSEDVDQAKRQTAIANRILSYVGLATGVRASLGHVSMRLPNDPTKFLVKGRGYRMDIILRMRPEDMVTCDSKAAGLTARRVHLELRSRCTPASTRPGRTFSPSCTCIRPFR